MEFDWPLRGEPGEKVSSPQHLNRGDSLAVAGLIITAVLTGLAPPLPLRILAVILGIAGCFIFVRKSYWTRSWGRSWRYVAAIAVAIVMIGVAVPQFIDQWKSEHIFVSTQFHDIFKRYRPFLGRPLANAMDVQGAAYQGRSKNATSLWTMVAAYNMWDNGKWEPLRESTAPPESEWNDYKWLQDHFSTDKPPQGSMAYALDRDPDKWRNIGELEWQCVATPHVVYQDFKRGRLIGIFRAELYDDTGTIYILFNDGTWKNEFVETVSGVTQVPAVVESQCSKPNVED
jgi:hypothetical protein